MTESNIKMSVLIYILYNDNKLYVKLVMLTSVQSMYCTIIKLLKNNHIDAEC